MLFSYNSLCFKIIDKAKSKFDLKIKEVCNDVELKMYVIKEV